MFIRHSLRKIRGASAARASARAMVTGQIVDTVTNMKTVKLFAHSAHEDRVALEAMAGFREQAIAYGDHLIMVPLYPVRPLPGCCRFCWSAARCGCGPRAAPPPGDIAAAGTISFRLAQMTGWVSFTLMSIFGNLGEVEDGMRTLTAPYTLTDAPDADRNAPRQGRGPDATTSPSPMAARPRMAAAGSMG